MKKIMTSALALGALCVLALNQPGHSTPNSNDPNFHLTRGGGHGGGGHGGGHHFSGGGHGGGHFAGGGHGYHGYHGHHDHGWGYGGWGAYGAGIATGVLGATILDNDYGDYGYDTGSDCWYDADGNYVCEDGYVDY